MAYFLPSYFQKRLLRYALSRLDFIDSEALDLDNLGVTIGQRSVIELKNVGIRVSKLVEKVDLPATVQPQHASIRLLRVTVPADLHASGIEVEIDGVDIEIAVDLKASGDKRPSQRRGAGNVPSHRDVANRPRLPTGEAHDPGGRGRLKTSHDAATSAIIPAPEDLAASFLQTEPEQEKRELESAVESRSIYLQQSSSGLDGSRSEDGTGMPEGFSLPGFVTNFFAGIADRLSVVVRQINVKVSLPLDHDRASPDVVDLVLKIEEIELQRVRAEMLEQKQPDARRGLRIAGLELQVVSEADVFAHKSTVSSPRLSKSRSSASTFSRASAKSPYRRTENVGSSSSSSFTSSNQDLLSQSVHESMLETSQIFEPSLAESRYASSTASPELSRLSPVTSRELSPDTPRVPYPSHEEASTRTSQSVMSKSSSQEEDESMYMSFVSARSSSERMPGGFESVDAEVSEAPRVRTVSTDTLRADQQIELHSTLPSIASSHTAPTSKELPDTHVPHRLLSRKQQCVKRFFRVNDINLKLPVKSSNPPGTSELGASVVGNTKSVVSPRDVSNTQYFASASHIRTVSEQSTYGIPEDLAVRLDESNSYGIDVGDLELMLDVPLCHLLLKVSTQLTSLTVKSQTTESLETIPSNQPDLHLNASVHSLIVNIMENVPEFEATTSQLLPTESTFSIRGERPPLLQLQLLSARLQMARVNSKLDSRFSLHRLGLYREAEKIVSFFDPATIQGSFIASSVILDPDDVVVRQLNNRFDIAIKPMHVRLDLLLLDDVLSRSGGLSSLLDLGSSVASASTTRDMGSSTSHMKSRRRSVHFDDSPQAKRPRSDSDTSLKLNMRVAAIVLDLVGSQSSLQIRTSSVKTVYRSSGLRTNISSISVKGPITHEGLSTDMLTLKLGDLEVAYVDTPSEDDLDRLLQLLAPSSDQHEQQDDDIMVDTLLRQRRKGGVLRLSLKELTLNARGISWVRRLSRLGEEISKLSTVTKYLPEDDRPGVLTFVVINTITAKLELDKLFGPLTLRAHLFEGAHISVPSLMAMRISSIKVIRGLNEPLIRELIPNIQQSTIMGPGMIMCRFIPDEMEPTVKLKLSDMALEYNVPLLLALTQLGESLQCSLANEKEVSSPRISEASSIASETSELSRKIRFSVSLRNTAIALKPLDSTACGLFVFTDTLISYSSKRQSTLINVGMRKASLMIIDDVARAGGDSGGPDVKFYFDQTDQIQELVKIGFVPVGSISAAEIEINIIDEKATDKSFVEVELRNNLLVLETCADSTQTLTQILGGLSPPTVPSKVDKFRTEVVPIEDMLASWTGNAYVAETGPEMGMQVDEEEDNSTPTPSTLLQPNAQSELSQILGEEDDGLLHNLDEDDLDDLAQESDDNNIAMTQSTHASIGGRSLHIAPVNITADGETNSSDSIMMHSLINFRDDHFMQTSTIGGTAHRWDSTQNTYAMGKERDMQRSPLKVKVRDVHIIWNMFDGYDWQYTRDAITHAVQEVESKAMAKQRRDSGRATGSEVDDESVVGDVLFNSIYINIPANRDPRELTNAINLDIGDMASETGSYATSTTVTATTNKRHSGPGNRAKRLRLKRSRSHKMTFELEGLAADFLTFPPGSGEIESSVDVRVRKIEVFDHIPTSRWKKFATYMHESGEREVGTDMVHIELLNVKPVAELTASEIVLKLTVLPLRLYVDQDALDFMTRFFEFKDDRVAPSGTPSSPPFIQRAEVNPIKIRLDFKPKRVDYAGLKSGKLTEFMNFVILERSDLVLRRTILYGVSGFDRLGIMLNNIWTPDVRNNQLPGVLAGLAPIRPLVDVGSGVRDLIAVPIREYKKDGRVVRSIQKGAIAFAKTTTTELVNLGAKLAIGTQTVLQNAEDLLAPQNKTQPDFNSDSDDDDYHREISNYADQPLGIVQGLRGAYASLERDLLLAKDAIVAVPGEIIADGSATGAAKVILKQSPTIILRPAIGVTKALGQAFLGAGNTLDRGNRRRIEDKYKRHH